MLSGRPICPRDFFLLPAVVPFFLISHANRFVGAKLQSLPMCLTIRTTALLDSPTFITRVLFADETKMFLSPRGGVSHIFSSFIATQTFVPFFSVSEEIIRGFELTRSIKGIKSRNHIERFFCVFVHFFISFVH